MFADANVLGAIHASAGMAAAASAAHLAITSGAGFPSPLGHVWIFDCGYRPVLGDDLLIATSVPL